MGAVFDALGMLVDVKPTLARVNAWLAPLDG